MPQALRTAYRIIFDLDAKDMVPWRIAELLVENFDVPRLGEALAKRCIFAIVNHVAYPDQATTTRIVLRAEGFASELWPELGIDEFHMDQLAWLEGYGN